MGILQECSPDRKISSSPSEKLLSKHLASPRGTQETKGQRSCSGLTAVFSVVTTLPTLVCSGNFRDGFNDQLDKILESVGDCLE